MEHADGEDGMNPIRISYVWHTVTGYEWLLHKLIEYPGGRFVCEIIAKETA